MIATYYTIVLTLIVAYILHCFYEIARLKRVRKLLEPYCYKNLTQDELDELIIKLINP